MINIKFFSLILLLFYPFSIYAQNIYPKYDGIQYNENTVYVEDALNRLYIVGLQYLNSGELTQSEISFQSILAFPYRSKDWRTTRYYKGKSHFYLGDIYFIQKNYRKAVSNYQIVSQDYGDIEEYSSAIYKLGRSLILLGEQDKGIQILKDYNYNYGTRDGLADNALYWIAQGYLGLENHIAALKILHQILRDFPQSGMAYDIRMLISKLETDYINTIPLTEQQEIQTTINNSRAKAEQLSQEKELIDRIKQLLVIKEQLLQIKERKLKLLDTIRQARVKALELKSINGDIKYGNFIQ